MILILLGLAAVALALSLFALVAFCRVAASEPDVNGDPERDSGMDDDEIEQLSRSWDHGSLQTETRPNLEYARRMNRESMRPTLH